MSIPQPQEQSAFETSKLIIRDHPYQFLPNLAAIYGDTCAVILQQLHWTIQRPYFEGEQLLVKRHNGLMFIRLWPFMWFDTLEGITKHLAKSTFYRYRGALEECQAMVVLPSLGEKILNSSRRNEEAAWYAVNHPIVHAHDQAYQAAYEAALNERRAQRDAIRRVDSSAHWRPAPGEDTSKKLDQWRASLSEVFAEDSLVPPPPSRGRGTIKTKKQPVVLSQSHIETEALPEVQTETVTPHEQPQSHIETSPVSEVSQSHIETDSNLTWEYNGSQLETGVSVNMGLTPLYKKTSSLELTTEDTPAALSTTEVAVVVESNSILSTAETITPAVPTIQHPLPGTAVLSLSSPRPEPAASLISRFLDSADKLGLHCSDEVAARIVEASPLAKMSDEAIARLIGPDRSEIGLDGSIGGPEKRAMLEQPALLRWLIFAWPGHRVEVEAFYSHKNQKPKLTGSFVTKWREEILPPKSWMRGLIEAEQAAIRREREKALASAAAKVENSLTPAKRRALDLEVFNRIERMAGSVDENKARVRRELLLNAEFIESLPSVEVRDEKAVPAWKQDVAQAEATWIPNQAEQLRLNRYIQNARYDFQDGKTLDEIKDDLNKSVPVPREREWVISMIEKQLNLKVA